METGTVSVLILEIILRAYVSKRNLYYEHRAKTVWEHRAKNRVWEHGAKNPVWEHGRGGKSRRHCMCGNTWRISVVRNPTSPKNISSPDGTIFFLQTLSVKSVVN